MMLPQDPAFATAGSPRPPVVGDEGYAPRGGPAWIVTARVPHGLRWLRRSRVLSLATALLAGCAGR